jgi:hypothetical protein
MAEVVDVDITLGVPTGGTGTVPTLSKLTAATKVDDAAFAPGSDRVVVIGAQADEAATDSVDEGDAGAVRMTLDRQLLTRATIASGGVASGAIASGAVASGAFASGALASGSIASGALASGSIASGAIAAGAIATGATSIAINEDVASADADTGVKIMFKRLDTPANSSGTDGDYEQPQMSAGRVWASAVITSVVPGVAATSLGKAEDAAHTSGDVGVMALAVRQDAQVDFGADGDYVPFSVNADGALRVSGSTGVTEFDTNVAYQDADAGVLGLTVRDDALSTLTEADGDYSVQRVNARGATWVELDATNEIAVGAADTSIPSSLSYKSIAFGANPTAEDAGDKTRVLGTRAGQIFTLGGHPNIISRSHEVADSDGAQSDALLVDISAGSKIVVTRMNVRADQSNSGNVEVRIGFGATVPAASLAGTNKIIIHEDLAAGDGHQIGSGDGIIAVGADGEDLRVTCEDPAGGSLYIQYSYFTIES